MEREEVSETPLRVGSSYRPRNVDYRPASLLAARDLHHLGQLQTTPPASKNSVAVCFDGFSGRDLTLLSHDEQA